MPINPNIALGVQPIQQPNMLGQMGQIMAIRAAQQEMEGSQEARNYFAKPVSERGDPSQLLGTKQGQAAYKALNEGQIKQLEAEQKRINLVGAGAGAVLENPTMETFTTVVSDLVNRGIYTPQQRDQAFATIGNDPSKIKAFVTPIFNQAISAEKRLSDITSRANAATAAGPGNRQATLAERIYEDKLKYGGDIVTTTIPDPENPGQRIEIQTRRPLRGNQLIPLEVAPMPMRVDISPSSATSAFQPSGGGGGGTPNVLATQVAPQGPTFAQPKPTIRQPVAVMKDNKAVLVPPEQAVGLQPATAFTEKQAAGKIETVRSLNTAISNLTDAIKPGGLLEKSTGSGFGRMVDASAAFVGKATEGAKAAASLAPIADLVLKMVPRFEGPQSDKDTQSYKEAAGQLANSGLPNETRKDAAKVILRLMKERKDQFGMSDQVGGGGAGGGAPADPLGIR